MKRLFVLTGLAVCAVICGGVGADAQQTNSDEGGRVMALEIAWNHALEAKDVKALDQVLANTFASIDIEWQHRDEGGISGEHQGAGVPAFAGGDGAKQCAGVRQRGGGGGNFSREGHGKRKGVCATRAICGHLDQDGWRVEMRGDLEHADRHQVDSRADGAGSDLGAIDFCRTRAAAVQLDAGRCV